MLNSLLILNAVSVDKPVSPVQELAVVSLRIDHQQRRHPAEVASERFRRRVVSYRGEDAVPFGKNLDVVSIDWPWRIEDKMHRAWDREDSAHRDD